MHDFKFSWIVANMWSNAIVLQGKRKLWELEFKVNEQNRFNKYCFNKRDQKLDLKILLWIYFSSIS